MNIKHDSDGECGELIARAINELIYAVKRSAVHGILIKRLIDRDDPLNGCLRCLRWQREDNMENVVNAYPDSTLEWKSVSEALAQAKIGGESEVRSVTLIQNRLVLSISKDTGELILTAVNKEALYNFIEDCISNLSIWN